MKTNLILIILVLMSANTFAASRATVPQSVKDLDATDVGFRIIEANDEAPTENVFYPENVKDELIGIAEQLYSVGIAKSQYVEEFKCKVNELVKIEQIRAAITDSNKRKCYQNFVNKFNADCIQNPTFGYYYPVVDNDDDRFHKKYKCDAKASTGKYNVDWGGDNEKHIKALYHSLYTNLIRRFQFQVIADPEFKVNEWEMATVKQCEPPFVRLPWGDFVAPASCKGSTGTDSKCTSHTQCCSQFCMIDSGDTEGSCLTEMSCYKLIQPLQECGQMPNGRLNAYCDNAQMRYLLDPRPEAEKASIKPPANAKLDKCIETNYNTSEIGECTLVGGLPSGDKPCCSDKIGAGGKCVTKMTCDTCLVGGSRVGAGEKCCPGYYPSVKGVCIQDFPPLNLPLDTRFEYKKHIKKSILKRVIDFIIPSAHAQDGVIDNTSGHDNCVAGVTCANNLSPEQEEQVNGMRENCLAPDLNSGNMPSDAEVQACLKTVDEMRNQWINENIQNGTNNDGQWSREDYLGRFNMTAIASKVGSDFKKCDFNSYNDSWRSASNTERNAEMVIRGFEYTFSGIGTNDYWIDKEGLSIYERAKEVAVQVRRYRTDLIKKYHEIDRKMACKCIAILGPAKYPDKANFFNSSCAEEKEQLTESLSGADGTSSNANLSQVEMDQATISETDLGASGVSHEKLLMDYLDLRIEAQFDRFNANADLEKQLTELSEFIIEQKWELAWEEKELIYKFVVRRTAKWISWVAGIIAVIAIIVVCAITFGTAAIVLICVAAVAAAGAIINEVSYNNSSDIVQEFTATAASRSIHASGVERRVHDTVTEDWYNKGFREYKHFDRNYIYAYFEAGHTKDERRNTTGLPSSMPAGSKCKAYGSSRICFKNAHATMFEGDPRFLLDVKFPEFVPNTAFEKDSKFLEEVELSWSTGIAALKGTCTDCSNSRSDSKKAKWLEDDILSDHDEKFLPKSGKWMANPFTKTMYDKLATGIRTYSNCIELKKCGAKHLGDDEDAFGYGFLFEQPGDVNNFISYVYQHHFHWPSISSSGMIAYPTMAMASYFEAMVYNLKLVGSLAANRGLNMGDLYDKYKSDWEKRQEDYAANATTQMGGDSTNSKYSKKFRMMFKRLNFKTGVGVADFQGEGGDIINTAGLSAGEKTAMENGVNKALAAAKHMKKTKHYNASIGNTPRAKAKQKAQQKWMQEFSSPLTKMPLTVGGKQLGMVKSSTSNIVNNYGDDPKKGKVASYTSPKFDFGSNSMPSPNYNKPSSGGTVPKTGITKVVDHSHLLNSAAKDHAMFKRDDSDSIFKIVSKAYFRNLSKVLSRKGDNEKLDEDIDLQNKLDSSKKDELKGLLQD